MSTSVGGEELSITDWSGTMTDLATPLGSNALPRPRTRSTAATLLLGVVGGAALGIAARAWMRLIAEDPAFTWTGTLFIVIGFTLFGSTQAVVIVARSRSTRRWLLSCARTLGVVGMLPLFIAAGAMMLPTVVGGGLARARTEWHPRARWAWVVVASAPLLIVGGQLLDSFGWSIHAAVGFVGLLGVYAAIVAATTWTFAAQPDGWRLPRWARTGGFVVLGLLIVWLTAGIALR